VPGHTVLLIYIVQRNDTFNPDPQPFNVKEDVILALNPKITIRR
jgi:hypothetical protein